jgi:ankyrin repeat protein
MKRFGLKKKKYAGKVKAHQTTPQAASSSQSAEAHRAEITNQLWLASSKLDFEGVKTALALGADTAAVDNTGNTALTQFCAAGFTNAKNAAASRDVALDLLAHGADPNAVSSKGHAALTLLCSKGFKTAETAAASRDVALQLLAHGADAGVVSKNGDTTLTLLCGLGFKTAETAVASRDVALQLLAHGADANALTKKGNTLLSLLCTWGFRTSGCAAASREVALELLAKGANPNAVNDKENPPLIWLCSEGFKTAETAVASRDVALQLLTQGANAGVMTKDGNTTLTLLCVEGFKTAETTAASRDVALQLLARGANANAVTKNRNTALASLCYWGFRTSERAAASRDVVLQLLAQGANVNQVTNKGSTTLTTIAEFGQGPAAIDIAKHLILKGVDVTHIKEGKTAENYAREQGNIEMATLIANAQRGVMPEPSPIASASAQDTAQQASLTTSSEHSPAPSAPQDCATVLHAYTAKATDQLSAASGEILTVLEKFDTGWWRCQQGTLVGLVPGSYLQMVKPTSSADSPAPLPPSVHAPSASSSSAAASTPTLQHDNSGLNALGQMTVSLTINHQELSFGRKLGEGGFGEVVQGTWRQMDVAIKRLHMKQMSAEALADFKNEAAIMAQLRSPHTVTLFGITLSPEYTMVMECMPRGALCDVLHSSEPLPWATRQQIALDMSLGLSFLHHERMLHRDLKSMNVLLDNHFHAKLADFGLSKIKQESNTTSAKGQSVGTVAWKAPELFKRGCKYTSECDVYSLGMTLWELASRKIPFADANDNGEISVWVLQGEQETIPADTPDGIKTVIQACWSSQADQRPSADKVVELLKASAPTAPLQQPATSPAPGYQFHSNRGRGQAVPGRPLLQASGDQGTRGGYQLHSTAVSSRGVRGRGDRGYQLNSNVDAGQGAQGQAGFFSPRGRAGYQMNSGAPTASADLTNAGPSQARGGYR